MIDFNNFFENEEELSKTLIVDFSHLCWRMIFSSAQNAKKEGLTKQEIYAFWRHLVMNGVFSLIERETYDKVVIAYDSRNYWRKKLYPQYKAHRKDARDKNKLIDFDEFYVVLNEFIEDFKVAFPNLFHLEIEGAEADDVIAIYVKENHKENQITVVTGDSDFIQLLKYPNVVIYDPIKKKNQSIPDHKKYLQIKIISGDKSDNIPAITGKKTMVENKANRIYSMGIENFSKEIEDENVVKRYELNTNLINFDFIPIEESRNISERINNYQTDKYKMGLALKFTAKYGLRKTGENLMGRMGRVLNSIGG